MLGRIRIASLVLTAYLAHAVQPGEVRIQSGTYTPGPSVRVSVRATLVEVGVTVRDHRGEAAGGFHASDFELLDNGKRQTITVFSEQRAAGTQTPAEAASPRTIALYFDDTHAARYDLTQATAAAAKLIDQDLGVRDRTGLFTDSGEVTQDFTTDRTVLREALGRVRVHPRPAGQSLGVCPTVTPYEAYAVSHYLDEEARARLITLATSCNCPTGDSKCVDMQPEVVQSLTSDLWDQFRGQSATSLDVLRVVVRHLATMAGTRVLVMLSPGFVTGDMDRRKSEIFDAALRAHIAINAVNPGGLAGGMRSRPLVQGQVLSEFMAAAAHATGGIFVENRNGIGEELMKLATAPQVSYILGFTPQGTANGKMHALKVQLKRGDGYQVDSRPGYFAETPPEPKETAQHRIDRAALAKDTLNGVTATVKVVADREAAIRVEVVVDAKKLRFVARDGKSVQQLTFVTVLEKANGEPVAAKQSVMDLELSEATRADFQANGIHTATTFQRPAGDWQVRQVVREAADNRIGAWTVRGPEHL
jgi:VWFA-related protein